MTLHIAQVEEECIERSGVRTYSFQIDKKIETLNRPVVKSKNCSNFFIGYVLDTSQCLESNLDLCRRKLSSETRDETFHDWWQAMTISKRQVLLNAATKTDSHRRRIRFLS